MRNYRLFLFKPTAINYPVDWNSSTYRELLLGELKADNVKVSLKLQDISSINFDLPENIFGEINPRLDEVLDNYIVELWYGDVTSNNTATIQRFIIIKSPLEYENGVKKYCYEASSLEHLLEFKQLLSWDGIKVKDFYRTIKYISATDNFTENPSTGNAAPTYSLNTSLYNPGGEEEPVLYITVPTTTAAITPPGPPSPFDIFMYQYRRNDTDLLNSETSLIEYEQNVPSGTLYQNQSGFKPGFYVPVLDANGKVTSIHIALPKDFKQFNSASKVFEIFLYDNPVSRHYAVGINTDEEIQASDMYLDLAQNQSDKFIFMCSSISGSNILETGNLPTTRQNLAKGQTVTGTGIPSDTKITALQLRQGIIRITISNNSSSTGNNLLTFDSLNASNYGAYAFTVQTVYSKNGLKLEHILLGTVETRDIDNDIDNSTLNEDGLLFDTDFTIGKIHDEIAAKYRSNIELNNLSKYQAIKNLAESFDAIAIFNSVTKTVSFYPDKNEQVTDFVNNGLIITQNNYLKNLTNDIDSSKIITKAYGAGKDNLSISLITPNGSNAWENYSYFLDTYHVEYPAASGVTIENDNINNANNNTGVKYTAFPTGTLARWIDSTEALKIAKWQYARDYFHDIMLGNLDPTVSEHDRYYNLYNLRSAAINDFVKEESKYFELKATEYKYKYLYNSYVKENDNAGSNLRQQNFVYKFSTSTTISDPGATYFRLNTSNFSTATEILIDNLDNTSNNRRTFLAAITNNKNPRIMLADSADVSNDDPTNYIFYQINSVSSADSGYIVLSVRYINRTQSGTIFTNNNTINLSFQTWEEIYETKYNEAIAASAFALVELNSLHYNLYNTRFDGTIAKVGDSDYIELVTNIQPNSFATKIIEIQGFLRKSRWDIDEDKLKPFVKEAIMSDSNLDNELDLLTTVEEYLKENSQPVITLSIDVLDFLASSQASVDWNKVKIGQIVNIYFPDFNVDTTAQLREIAIDFQSNQLNFTISTYRQYTRLPATYIMRQIRRTYDIQNNKINYDYDLNRIGSARGTLTEMKFRKQIGFAAENAPIKLGAKSSDGTASTEISGEGFVSKIIAVDPILETFTYASTKTLSIADGNLLARNVVSGSLTSEIEISGDNGFVIRKTNNNGDFVKQVYIDTDGNAVFAGTLEVGSNAYNQVVSLAGAGTTVFKAGTIEQFQAITTANLNDLLLITSNFTDTAPNPNRDYVKDDIYRYDLITAPSTYDWVLAADLKTKITGSVGGWIIDSTSIKSSDFILQNHISNPYLSINQSQNGPGWYNPDPAANSNKYGIFLGYSGGLGRMSIASENNYLVWTGTELKLKGNLAGEISAINIESTDEFAPLNTGVYITAEGIAGKRNNIANFYLQAASGYGLIAGWNFDNEAIYTGTKTATGNFTSTPGDITIGADGHISANKFRINADGSAIFTGFVSINQDTIGYDNQGIFIGEDNSVSKFSLVSGNTFMVFDPSATDYKLKISGEAKIGPLTIGSVGNTFITFTSNSTPINYIKKLTTTTFNSAIIGPINTTGLSVGMSVLGTGIQTGSTLTSLSPNVTMSLVATQPGTSTRTLTYAVTSADYYFTLSDISSITINSSGTHDQSGTPILQNAIIYVEVYNNTTLLYTTSTITETSFFPPIFNNSYILDLNQVYSSNRIKVYTSATTTTTSGSWNVVPSVLAVTSSINMGNFSVNPNGDITGKNITNNGNLTTTGSASFGSSSNDRILIRGNSFTTPFTATIEPSNLSADQTFTLPNASGTALVSTNGTYPSSTTATDIFIVSRALSTSDIELVANDNIRLQSSDGVRFYGATVPSTGTTNYTKFIRPNENVVNTINIPVTPGTIGLFRHSATELENKNIQFRIGRYTGSVAGDGIVGITFAPAFPAGLTYGVIAQGVTTTMNLSGTRFTYSVRDILSTGFTFINDSPDSAQSGFTWIAFAY